MPYVELFAIPVLLKAVDFLFGEAQKMMEERRTDRQENASLPAPPEIPLLGRTKDSLLQTRVSEELARQQEKEVGHILELLEGYRQNRHWAREQVMNYGGLAHAPIITRNTLLTQEKEIFKLSQELAEIVERLSRGSK